MCYNGISEVNLRTQRKQANEELLRILTEIVKNTNGNLRFSQILAGYGFVSDANPLVHGPGQFWENEFYCEPNVILERVKKLYREIEGDDI